MKNARFPITRRTAVLGGLLAPWPAMDSLAASAEDAARDTALTAALQALVDDTARPLAGLSVLCLQAGRTVFEAQLGRRVIADATHPDLPVTRDTLFRMASLSKLAVSLGVMRLVDAGKLDLDVDVGELLGFALRHPRFAQTPITPRLLLSHRASLSDEGGYRFDADVPLRSVLMPGGKHFAAGRSWLAKQPGTYFQYCNFNYGVLASVLEKASGQRFDRFMQQQVIDPLGMAGGFDPSQFSDPELANLATLYRKRTADEKWDTAGPWLAQTDAFGGVRPAAPAVPESYALGSNGTLFGPQGSLRTRVQDLAKVMHMLLAQGVWKGGAFLSPKSVQTLLTEQWRFDAKVANGDTVHGMLQAWGVGWQHFIDRSAQVDGAGSGDRFVQRGGVRAWGHLGDAYGLTSGLMLNPQSGNGVVFAISGTGADPEKNRATYSSFSRWEERLLDLAWNRVL